MEAPASKYRFSAAFSKRINIKREIPKLLDLSSSRVVEGLVEDNNFWNSFVAQIKNEENNREQMPEIIALRNISKDSARGVCAQSIVLIDLGLHESEACHRYVTQHIQMLLNKEGRTIFNDTQDIEERVKLFLDDLHVRYCDAYKKIYSKGTDSFDYQPSEDEGIYIRTVESLQKEKDENLIYASRSFIELPMNKEYETYIKWHANMIFYQLKENGGMQPVDAGDLTMIWDIEKRFSNVRENCKQNWQTNITKAFNSEKKV